MGSNPVQLLSDALKRQGMEAQVRGRPCQALHAFIHSFIHLLHLSKTLKCFKHCPGAGADQ